ncbi:MAG: ATP-binding protein, partial [Thermoplasmata archaeon]|nr:ATP-binding protein [Thermoplasmata archaeon]
MPIILTMIIVRPREIDSLKRGGWLFIYGRRKTGKTFLVENFMEYDEFFFVKRDRTILLKDEWREFDYVTFVEVLRRDLAAGKTVVVDEFHRLGDDFLDLLHALPKNGKLVLLSSTLHTAKMLIDKSSPLLGRFAELNVGIISLGDAMNALGEGASPMEMMEKAVFMREPITIDRLEKGGICDLIGGFALTIPALTGEIFSEEDRKMTKTYEGAIRATAVGKCTSGEISSFLYSRRLIEKDDPSTIQQYLNNLVGLGILEKTPVWGKKRFVYSHTSPLTRTYYHLDERYSIGDRKVSEE